MSQNIDCFVDEVKDGGKIIALGVLLMEVGVLEGMAHSLHEPIARLEGAGTKVGELHWAQLGKVDAMVAEEWLRNFFRAPLTFFVLVTKVGNESKAAMLKRLITVLEADARIRGGFSRTTTTIHFDTDESDPRSLLRDLRRDFGLLRAFKWDSKGSLLLQLSDLLLGIARQVMVEGTHGAQAGDVSERTRIRRDVISKARSIAQESADRGKVNGILVLDNSTIRFLLQEQARGGR
jgi:hypothetical protein